MGTLPIVYDRVQDLTDFTGTPAASRQFRYARGKWQPLPAMWVDITDFAPTGVSITGKSNATETTQALVDALAEVEDFGGAVFFPAGDYLVNGATIVTTFQAKFFGVGEERSRIYANSAGALVKHDAALSGSTGMGITVQDMGFYSERATTAAGDTGLWITDAGSDSNTAFSYVERCVFEGFHDGIVLENAYFCQIRGNYIGDYRRYGIQVSNNHTIDAGDHVIEGNWIQPKSSGGGYDAAGCNIRLQQHAGTRVFDNKIFPGHLIGIHVHPNATFTTESFPTLMTIIGPSNQFDSFGSTGTAVVVEGIYGTGVTGETQHGNKVANVQIHGNNANGTGRLVDIRSEFVHGIGIVGNVCFGGGGIRVGATAVVDGLFVASNYFDNRSQGTTIGAAGSGYGPSKFIEYASGATVTNAKAVGNFEVGFIATSDLEDTGGATVDFSPAAVQTDLATGVAVVDLSGNTPSHDTWTPLTEAGAVKLGDDLAPGQHGTATVIGKLASGTAALSWTNPTDTTIKVLWEQSTTSGVVTYSTTAPTITALDHDDVRQFIWRCVGGDNFDYLFVRYHDCGNIVGSTDVPGVGAALMEDSFDTNPGGINGRVPDVTQVGSVTWVHSDGWISVHADDYAYTTLESLTHATYDVGAADVVITATVSANSGNIWGRLIFNYQDANNYWFLAWRTSDGYTRVMKRIAGTETEMSSTFVSVAADVQMEIELTVVGDTIDVVIDGSTIGALAVNDSGRALKTADIVGIGNGPSGITKFYSFRVDEPA
jgi:hypothetical protein